MQLFPREVALVNVQRRQLLRMAMIGVAAALFPACRDGSPGGVGALSPGDRFPDIDLPYLDGRKEPFSAHPDVPLVVNFWASWCEPCRHEMPDLEKLSALFPHGELMVVGITVDSDVNLAREFSLQNRLTFPLLSDKSMALSNGLLRIPAFPMTYLLKRDHTVARIIAGGRDWADPGMVAEIKGLLG